MTSTMEAALDPARLRGLARAADHAGEHGADGGQHHLGLAEGRQHLLDVAQEGRVGSDHQHPAAGELLAVGVEQVGGAVQRDDGLAGARTALDHQDPGQPGADDRVLLGLDGGDDLRHPAGAVGRQRREQGRLADQVRPLVAVQRGQVEEVVVDADDRPSGQPEVAPPEDPAGSAAVAR